MGSNGQGDDKSSSRIRLVYLHFYNALNIILQQEAISFIHIRKNGKAFVTSQKMM